MPWYGTGTVAVTANSATITGTGTAFSANARVGDAFRGPDGRWYEVTNIASATALSIRPNYQGSTASGQAYAIAPMQGYVKESADRLRQLVDQFGSQLAALQPWATAATAAEARTALGASTSGGMVLTGSPAQGRTALGLGTAATVNVQTSPTDTTPGALMAVGAGGWLSTSVAYTYPSGSDTLALWGAPTAVHSYGVADYINPPPGRFFNVLHIQQGNTAGDLSFGMVSDSFALRRGIDGVYGPWRTIFHDGNILGTVSQSGGVPTGAVFQFTETAAGQTWRNAAGLQICTNSNNPITTDPAAFVGTPTSLDNDKMKMGRWF